MRQCKNVARTCHTHTTTHRYITHKHTNKQHKHPPINKLQRNNTYDIRQSAPLDSEAALQVLELRERALVLHNVPLRSGGHAAFQLALHELTAFGLLPPRLLLRVRATNQLLARARTDRYAPSSSLPTRNSLQFTPEVPLRLAEAIGTAMARWPHSFKRDLLALLSGAERVNDSDIRKALRVGRLHPRFTEDMEKQFHLALRHNDAPNASAAKSVAQPSRLASSGSASARLQSSVCYVLILTLIFVCILFYVTFHFGVGICLYSVLESILFFVFGLVTLFCFLFAIDFRCAK